MRITFSFFVALFLLSGVSYASEVKIKLKDNVVNNDSEIFLYISGEFEHERYLIKPKTQDETHVATYDAKSMLWRHNNDLWSNQILVEDLQLLKLGNMVNDAGLIQFELLDLETSTKYLSPKLMIFSNREDLAFLDALNQNLQKW